MFILLNGRVLDISGTLGGWSVHAKAISAGDLHSSQARCWRHCLASVRGTYGFPDSDGFCRGRQ
jgi:hypothetical protein